MKKQERPSQNPAQAPERVRPQKVWDSFNIKHSLSALVRFLILTSAGVSFAAASVLGLLYVWNTTGALPAWHLLLLYIGASVVSTLLVVRSARKIVKRRIITPIRLLAETADQYARDNEDGRLDESHFSTLQLNTGDELDTLAKILSGMECDIADSQKKLIRVAAERQRISTELSVANDIQRNMLPNLFPPFPERKEFDIYASMNPARAVGGDFFDFLLVDDNHLALVMADVSGKGIPAALFMMSSMIVIENYASLGYPPAEVLHRSNESICAMKLVNMFVTVWFGILDLTTGTVVAANAGHEYPAICQPGGDFELVKKRHGFVIGGMENTVYREYSFTLEKGAALFLYTDGVPEASTSENELYGTDRMLSALNKNKELPPKELLAAVSADINGFVKEAEQFDDLTMMCVRYNGK